MWKLFIDTGGTFTDALGVSPDATVRRAKVLSSGILRARVLDVLGPDALRIHESWDACDDLPTGWTIRSGSGESGTVAGFAAATSILHTTGGLPGRLRPGSIIEVPCPDEAPILAARIITRTRATEPLPPIAMRLATTRGTNALLTGSVPPVTLFITRGLGDLLLIGTQQRPDLFALDIRRPEHLCHTVVEVDERLAADGSVITEIDLPALERAARAELAQGRRIAAVAFLHADINPEHERRAAEVLQRIGFAVAPISSDVAGFIKLLPRAQTTVVEAALAPIISSYLASITRSLGAGRLEVLTSAGGIVPAADYRAKDSLLSGPAGGVVGAGAAAISAGEAEVLAFDMGGTSTDVSRWAGRVDRVFEHTVGPSTLVAPAVDIHTVAAGGGSVCGFDGAALTVGPGSAGADPGPASYGRGGPLTLTDVQLLAGRLAPDRFGIPLENERARDALGEVVSAMPQSAGGETPSADRVLDAFLDIAAERIAGAIRVVSSRRGHDPATAALLAFGGAGGQIACMVAERLGIRRVIVPPDAGLLSARGLAAAQYEHIAQRQVLGLLDEVRLGSIADELEPEARMRVEAMLRAASATRSQVSIRVEAALRYLGQETPVEVDLDRRGDGAAAAFEEAYRRIYGYLPRQGRIEVVWVRVIARAGDDALAAGRPGPAPVAADVAAANRPMRTRGQLVAARIIDRRSLTPGAQVNGPALIVEEHCTTVVESGWRVVVLGDGALRIDSTGSPAPASALREAQVELFTCRLESIACEMGEALQRTSYSVNVKERLDYSCAVLDSAARLLACAPHVPVHLGSLGVCVRRVLARLDIAPGEVIVTNHPAFGGSHLPDVTVIGGAFDAAGRIIGYVAARAHHAEIGGVRPGSMPPDATRLADEGAVLRPMLVVRDGRESFEELIAALTAGPFPTRALLANIEDIRAAIAACSRGAGELTALAAERGSGTVAAMLAAVQERSASAARKAIKRLGTLDTTAEDRLDDGSPLCVRITSDGRSLGFDFTGSAPVHPGNLNATPAIVNSCLMYVMRVLCGHGLPLNEGLMDPVRVVLPAGMLNPPFDPAADPATQPAVVGGNVETSQRLVNLLLHTLGLCAHSQGTMNNVIFGDSTRSYYETICGGAGAGPGFTGASAVHTHMTNTRITDPEILERRYPVRLERFAVRRGSGGVGAFAGGDGVERAIRFLAPMTVSVLTQRRVHGPIGGGGGGDGAPGRQWVVRADGSVQPLGPIEGASVTAGDMLVMHTPGGGGWGPSPSTSTKVK